jgi:CCR4-NOT transcriptional regulation complex NOT5 subunit
MLVAYQTIIINGTTYITGYYACAPDNPNAVQLDSQLDGISQWLDDSGNPLWVLNGDGSVGNAPILSTSKSLNSSAVQQMTMPDLLAQIPDEIISVINSFVTGTALTSDQVTAWNTAYAQHTTQIINISDTSSSTDTVTTQ